MQSRKMALGLAVLAAFMVVDSALAYYNPATGRFLNRDPIGEPGFRVVQRAAAPTAFLPRDTVADQRHVYAYVRNSPTSYVDPLGLQATKPKTQCKLNGQPVTMTFDGQTFSGSGYSYPAASGKPIKQEESEQYRRFVKIYPPDNPWINEELHWFKDITYTFDYSKERQQLNGVGPTKEGKYWIDTCCTNSCANANRHKWWHPAKGGWGDYSWEMRPYPETDMSGKDGPRSGFFVHGGNRWGSAGCIDLLNNDVTFYNDVIKNVQFDPGETCCFIDILVKYAVKKVTMTQTVDLGLSW